MSYEILVSITFGNPYHTTGNGENNNVAVKSVEAPGFFVRIIPTATSLFNIAKLNLKRNNVRAFNQGSVLALV